MKKEINVLYAPTLSKLITYANNMGIEKDEIINILSMPEQYAMIYDGEKRDSINE